MNEITVELLKQRLDKGERLILIDCREPYEFEVSRLSEYNYPLDRIESLVVDFENQKEAEIIVYCRSGRRSLIMVNMLQSLGFQNVKNLKGGILAWQAQIDSSLPVA
ncbi:MAG: rhodanese-like domain-containing protein [Bacteroidia bacterium]|nr:rhodanese-like domain-containing protein [Bacteroidia bacterium]MDW8158177.1 rhodanese-like domain-containing protein [Bacteroidia bacterium]